ncbi:hypothetical protein ACNEP5_26700 [Escherichia coli]
MRASKLFSTQPVYMTSGAISKVSTLSALWNTAVEESKKGHQPDNIIKPELSGFHLI